MILEELKCISPCLYLCQGVWLNLSSKVAHLMSLDERIFNQVSHWRVGEVYQVPCVGVLHQPHVLLPGQLGSLGHKTGNICKAGNLKIQSPILRIFVSL